MHKSNYTCEWAMRGRRGLSQTSRFALYHTSDHIQAKKPFISALPGEISFPDTFCDRNDLKTYSECNKSFTRSNEHISLLLQEEAAAPANVNVRLTIKYRKRQSQSHLLPCWRLMPFLMLAASAHSKFKHEHRPKLWRIWSLF